MRLTIMAICVLAISVSQVAVAAAAFVRESDVPALRLGQRVYVDDATCPTGQIKEITGKKLTASGVSAVKRCVARKDAHPN